MKEFLGIFSASFAAFFMLFLATQVISNSRSLTTSQSLYHFLLEELPGPTPDYEAVRAEAKQRFSFYEQQIDTQFLDHGMVVHKRWQRDVIHECDSLLFSSLRYVALVKMGLQDRALAAWQAIESSQNNGKWFRHPTCHKRTSRDMLFGLLVALTQNPPNKTQHLKNLLRYIYANNGYFGDGPFYVSFLSPSLAELVQVMGKQAGLDEPFPHIPRFSTMEFDTYFANKGFESHLMALNLWLEMEIQQQVPLRIASVASAAENVFAPFTFDKLGEQRHIWVSQRLYESNPKNLFYKWLHYRARGILNKETRARMLVELLNMPQFPRGRMPDQCDRRADYLWQRAPRDYVPWTTNCEETFNGVDFLWMTALLLDPIEGENLAH